MAVRKIVKIDELLCNGCGACVPACAEGAIQVIDGKARLVADRLCDGLGACLGDCPQGAITIEDRAAEDYDEDAVRQHLHALATDSRAAHESAESDRQPVVPGPGAALPLAAGPEPGSGCPGSRVIQFQGPQTQASTPAGEGQSSQLRQWPVQLHLVPADAPYFRDADLLLAADCTAFALGDFHRTYLKGRALAVACPKLDHGLDIYLQKLTAMIDQGGINTLTVMVMQVPCCAGLTHLAQQAASQAKRKVPVKRVVVSLQGDILSQEWL